MYCIVHERVDRRIDERTSRNSCSFVESRRICRYRCVGGFMERRHSKGRKSVYRRRRAYRGSRSIWFVNVQGSDLASVSMNRYVETFFEKKFHIHAFARYEQTWCWIYPSCAI